MSGQDARELTGKQEALIAALLTETTHQAAAAKARVSEATLRRWLHQPAFLDGYRAARRQLLDAALGRIQAATGIAVDTLLAVAKDSPKDGDRVRAAVALLDHALKGLELGDALHGDRQAANHSPMATADVVKVLAGRLREIDAAELPAGDKARLTATLADALLRAIGVDVLDKRLEALQAVLIGRKDTGER